VTIFRVLIAYEEAYLAYAEVLGAAVGYAEPEAEVRVVPPRELRAEVARFEPHLVISSRPTDVSPGVGAWYRLSPEPDEPSEMRLSGRRWACTNPDLGALARIVDSVAGLVRDGRDPADV